MGTYVYELPWHQTQTGPLGKLVGGWGVSGMTILRSGAAFNVFEPEDRCLCGIFFVGTPDYIGGDIASTNFGRILETADPRIIQFTLQYMF